MAATSAKAKSKQKTTRALMVILLLHRSFPPSSPLRNLAKICNSKILTVSKCNKSCTDPHMLQGAGLSDVSSFRAPWGQVPAWRGCSMLMWVSKIPFRSLESPRECIVFASQLCTIPKGISSWPSPNPSFKCFRPLDRGHHDVLHLQHG